MTVPSASVIKIAKTTFAFTCSCMASLVPVCHFSLDFILDFCAKRCITLSKQLLVCAVNLTKVKKKTREWKSALLEKVRTLCDKHSSVYVIKYYNMRNDRFKELREVRWDSPHCVHYRALSSRATWTGDVSSLAFQKQTCCLGLLVDFMKPVACPQCQLFVYNECLEIRPEHSRDKACGCAGPSGVFLFYASIHEEAAGCPRQRRRE